MSTEVIVLQLWKTDMFLKAALRSSELGNVQEIYSMSFYFKEVPADWITILRGWDTAENLLFSLSI